jgi:transposase
MSTPRRKYTPEFKLEAVRLVSDQGQTIAEVARSLDIHTGLLHQWRTAVKKNGALAFSGTSPDKLESEEVRKLRRELKIAREERDILKKALGFFAKPKD